jgi:hypothetical protein
LSTELTAAGVSPDAAALTVAASKKCRNCGYAFGPTPPNYCPQCAQESHEHPPTVAEFLHEFVLHYIALEGKLWRTLALLFFKPGSLTRYYLAGVKGRYVPPLRLYLTASILFFLVVKFAGVGNLFKINPDTAPAKPAQSRSQPLTTDEQRAEVQAQVQDELQKQAQAALAAARKQLPAASADKLEKVMKPGLVVGANRPQGITLDGLSTEALEKPAKDVVQCLPNNTNCLKVKDYISTRYGNQTVGEVTRHVRDKMLSLAPYALFLFLPLFALLTKILYFRRGMYYGEHLVYAFHVHTFAFFVLLGIAFIPEEYGGILALVAQVYFWLAMRRVFGGRWWATTLRYFGISVIYPMMLVFLIGATLVAAIII